MELGLVGLGKMGGNMRQRIRNAGHTVVGFDHNPDISDAKDLADMVGKLTATDQPKVVWIMVPVQAIDPVIAELSELLSPGDIVIDGGNSRWTDDTRRAAQLAEKDIKFVDCGVSGGVWGLENGYALMCGGDNETVATVMPILEALKPEGDFGFVHAGKVGAGHFTKMVHNGTDVVENVPEAFESWREGTVIRSWLLDLMVNALKEDTHLDKIRGYAEDSGEGRWTVEAAIDNAVPVPAIAASLFARFASRQDDSPAMKAIAAMRNQFGGHAVKGAEDPSYATPPTKH